MTERDRPLFHFTPLAGWMNDPNGLVFVAGAYHLFYQHVPPGQGSTATPAFLAHWGHAVSPDLVGWTHLPIALFPDNLGAIFSGCVVVDTHDTSGFFGGRPGLMAIFTHHNTTSPPLGPEIQSIASSDDGGQTWTTYARNPVIPNPGTPDFRDPKVFWHAPTRRWVMVVTFNGDRVRFYVSPNLCAWSYVSEFGMGHGAPGGTWECPDLFELAVEGDPGHRAWVLQVSTYHATEMADQVGLQYFIGDFDGTTFTNANPADTVLTTDYGKDNYAAVTWSTREGRRVLIGWMNNWTYAREVPTETWKGAMTIPRDLQLRRCSAGVRLRQTPVSELERLRARHAHWSNHALSPTTSVWDHDVTAGMEIVATFQPGSAAECGIRVHGGASEDTTIGYENGAARVFVDRTRSGRTAFSPAFPGCHGGPLSLVEGAVTLRIFVDRTSVEVFGNEGEAVVTSLIFPESETTGLEIYATGGDARLVALDVYHLRAP